MHGIHGSDHHLLALVKSAAPASTIAVGTTASIEISGSAPAHGRQGLAKGWGLGRHVLGSNYFHYIAIRGAASRNIPATSTTSRSRNNGWLEITNQKLPFLYGDRSRPTTSPRTTKGRPKPSREVRRRNLKSLVDVKGGAREVSVKKAAPNPIGGKEMNGLSLSCFRGAFAAAAVIVAIATTSFGVARAPAQTGEPDYVAHHGGG